MPARPCCAAGCARPGRRGRPLDLLLAHDFGAFEDALATLAQRGFVLRGGALSLSSSSGSGRFSPGQAPVR